MSIKYCKNCHKSYKDSPYSYCSKSCGVKYEDRIRWNNGAKKCVRFDCPRPQKKGYLTCTPECLYDHEQMLKKLPPGSNTVSPIKRRCVVCGKTPYHEIVFERIGGSHPHTSRDYHIRWSPACSLEHLAIARSMKRIGPDWY